MLNDSFFICSKTAPSCLHTQCCLKGREINLTLRLIMAPCIIHDFIIHHFDILHIMSPLKV